MPTSDILHVKKREDNPKENLDKNRKFGERFVSGTGAKPTLGPNCMIPYGIIQFGPKAGLVPVVFGFLGGREVWKLKII